MTIFRKIRAAIGNAIAWAACGSLFGILIGLVAAAVSTVPLPASLFTMLVGLATSYGIVGFVTGGVFSAALAATYRDVELEHLNRGRVALLGAVAGGVPTFGLGAIALLAGSQGATITGVIGGTAFFAMFGAAIAAGILRVALGPRQIVPVLGAGGDPRLVSSRACPRCGFAVSSDDSICENYPGGRLRRRCGFDLRKVVGAASPDVMGVETELSEGEGLEAGWDPFLLCAHGVVNGGFLLGSVGLLLNGWSGVVPEVFVGLPHQLVGVLGIVVFGWGSSLSAHALFDPRPRLEISAEGVVNRTLWSRPILIRWEEVVEIRQRAWPGLREIVLRDPAEWLARQPRSVRMWSAYARLLGMGRVPLNLWGLTSTWSALDTRLQSASETAELESYRARAIVASRDCREETSDVDS